MREPRFAGPLLRDWLVALWATKGGGFYGLGYVGTLLTLEVFSLEQDVVTKDTSSFLTSQAIQYVAGFGADSLMNTIRATVWPAFLFDWLGLPGIAAFLIGGAAFERFVRPRVEARLPDLAAARTARIATREQRRERKRGARAKGAGKSSTE